MASAGRVGPQKLVYNLDVIVVLHAPHASAANFAPCSPRATYLLFHSIAEQIVPKSDAATDTSNDQHIVAIKGDR